MRKQGQCGEILDQLSVFNLKSSPLFGEYNHFFFLFFFYNAFFEIILIDDSSSLVHCFISDQKKFSNCPCYDG